MYQKYIAVIGALLCGVAVSRAVEDKMVLQPGPEGVDKWFGSYYNKQGVNNGILRVGGWGDYYNSLIKFDGATQTVPGSFKRAELWLYHFNTTRPTDINMWLLKTRWSEAPWDHANLAGYYLGRYYGPSIGSGWYGIDITSSVNYWRLAPSLNYGLLLTPAANDNRYDEFYSSDSSSVTLRPKLHVIYDLDFKMPLPGGKAWKLTVEAGGKANDGIDDPFHKGTTYYSLDFSPWSVQASGIGPMYPETDAPVLAMEGGKVYFVGNDPGHPNGYHVKIDHGCDNDTSSGFQTVYSHFKSPPLVTKGQIVIQGQKLGIMGNTGISTATHLHVTAYFQGTASGEGTDPQLNQLSIEGRLIKDYKLNYLSPSTPIFYPSSNVIK